MQLRDPEFQGPRGTGLATNRADGHCARANLAEDEVDLQELMSAVWSSKLLIFLITVAFSIGAIVFSLQMPNLYKGEVILVPASIEEKGALSGLAGQFGGLASLAGINLGGTSLDKTTLALEILKSRAFIGAFIKRHEITVPLIAATGWSENSQEWVIDEEIYNTATQQWVRKVEPSKSKVPTDWELYKLFRDDVLTVTKDDKTGVVKLSAESLSPVAAQQWATWLVKDLNQHMRELDISEAKRSIEYLQKQAEQTSISGMQQVFYQLIEQQTKTVMLAQIRDEYVFKTVDPAVVPEEKSSPKRAMICIFATFFGALIALSFVVIRFYFRSHPSRESQSRVSCASGQ